MNRRGTLGFDPSPFEEVKVKIEKVDLWADRMDLAPDGFDEGNEADGFGDGLGADLCLQKLCRRRILEMT